MNRGRVHMSTKPHYLMQFFQSDHLPTRLADVVKFFRGLAVIVDGLPDNPEKTTALRKLLESKDCAVRAVLYEEQKQGNNKGEG